MKSETVEKRCSQLVYYGVWNPASTERCRWKPFVFVDGRWWCKRHSPEAQDKRDAKRVAAIEAKFSSKPDERATKIDALESELSLLRLQLAEAVEGLEHYGKHCDDCGHFLSSHLDESRCGLSKCDCEGFMSLAANCLDKIKKMEGEDGD